jgi:hypothetical protein
MEIPTGALTFPSPSEDVCDPDMRRIWNSASIFGNRGWHLYIEHVFFSSERSFEFHHE